MSAIMFLLPGARVKAAVFQLCLFDGCKFRGCKNYINDNYMFPVLNPSCSIFPVAIIHDAPPGVNWQLCAMELF